MKAAFQITSILVLLAMTAAIGLSQAKGKTNKRPVDKAATSTPAPTPQATPEVEPPKRNGRPDASPAATPIPKINASGPQYTYIFTRPGFTYSRIVVEHDDAGKGQISFQKTSFDEAIVDPISLSATTMSNLTEALAEMNFLESADDYQFPGRDYSHLGNIEFTLKNGAKARTARYNWTENKYAKILMDEYRRISNEYTWRFEIDLARQNQQLLTPGLMEAIGGYIDRKEISDPAHLLPFLKELSSDERLPLMARNRASKIIKAVEKETTKNAK